MFLKERDFMYCRNCGTIVENENQKICELCGATLFGDETVGQVQLPMKWHKFLVYFAIIFGAVLNFITAIGYLTGSVYVSQGAFASDVYYVFPALKPVDMVYAVILIAFSVFDVYVWWNLKGFKTGAYKLVPVTYIIGCVIGVLYQVVITVFIMAPVVDLGSVGGFAEVISSVVTSVVVSVVMAICNKIYYDKRAHLFVN